MATLTEKERLAAIKTFRQNHEDKIRATIV